MDSIIPVFSAPHLIPVHKQPAASTSYVLKISHQTMVLFYLLCNMCLPFLSPSPDFAEFQEEIRSKQASAFCHMKLLASPLHIILSWILHLLSLIGFSVSLSAFIFLS